MATFMHRLSGNAPGIGPSVNAATLDGHTADDIVAEAAPTAMLPVAFGVVDSTGVVTGSGNFTAAWQEGLTRYVIGIDDVHYHFETHVTVVTVQSCPSGEVLPTRTTSSAGSLVVRFAENEPCTFNFVSYAGH